MLLQIHDELVFEAPAAEIPRLAELVNRVMTSALRSVSPLEGRYRRRPQLARRRLDPAVTQCQSIIKLRRPNPFKAEVGDRGTETRFFRPEPWETHCSVRHDCV